MMSQVKIVRRLVLLQLLLCVPYSQPRVMKKSEVKSQIYQFLYSSLKVPALEVYQVNRDAVDSFSRQQKLVNVSRNSDFQYGEEDALLLHCHASYPVQFLYQGDSDPEFNTNTTTKRDANGNNLYIANLFLGGRRKLTERETGRYICTGVRNRKLYSYVYIFVTNASLFTNKGQDSVYYGDADDSIRIPCSLSEPRALTTLQKSENGVLKCPMNDSVRFDPKQGFILDPKKLQSPDGTYLCIANYNDTFQIIKYEVRKDNGTTSEQTSEFDPLPNEPIQNSKPPPASQPTPPPILDPPSSSETSMFCGSTACGPNAFCKTNKVGDRMCKCRTGYTGNPYIECKEKVQTTTSTPGSSEESGASPDLPCQSYDDCPNDRACIKNTCQDPCQVNSICGPNTHCETQYHTPLCQCNEGYEGDPYSFQEGQQCERSYCTPNPCGPNTVCKYINGIISCACEPGYSTQHDGVCRRNQITASQRKPVVLLPTIPDSLVENRTLNRPIQSRKECHYDADCDDDKMCIQDKCEDPCVNACGAGARCHTRNHFPRCVCPEGTTGDPFYKCTMLFSELLGSSGITPPPLASHDTDIRKTDCGGTESPCGPNSVCHAARNHFVCVCPNDFTGDPYSSIGCVRQRGYQKCQRDSECPHFLTCFKQHGCVNPCNVKNICSEGRSCVPYLHKPACLKTENHFVTVPRDGLTQPEIKDELEVTSIPDGLKSSQCFIKTENHITSPCGTNSICYEGNDITPSGMGRDGIFCGCKEGHIGDPYVACNPIRLCKDSANFSCSENETCINGICKGDHNETIGLTSFLKRAGTLVCSPSPCDSPSQQCVVLRENHSAKCILTSGEIQSSESRFRSDLCELLGNCDGASESSEEALQMTNFSSNDDLKATHHKTNIFDVYDYSTEDLSLPVKYDEDTVVDI